MWLLKQFRLKFFKLEGMSVQLNFRLGTSQTSTQQQGTSFELFEFQLGTLQLTCNLSVHNSQINIVHHDHIAIFTWLSTHIIVHRSETSNFRKRVFQFKIQLFVLTKKLAKQLILVAQSILKLDNLGRKTLEG
jgi:hypothetical protein